MELACIQRGSSAAVALPPRRSPPGEGGSDRDLSLSGVGALERVVIRLYAARLTFNVFRYLLVVFIQQVAIILTVISEH